MRSTTDIKTVRRARRHRKIRSVVHGTPSRPRLAVFRSNRYISAQLIDDTTGTTLASADSRLVSKSTGTKGAKAVGAHIADTAKAQKITDVVFDRGGFLYAGKVKALAEGAREGGLKF